LKVEDAAVERKRLFDIPDFQRHVVEAEQPTRYRANPGVGWGFASLEKSGTPASARCRLRAVFSLV
jgi:hypothetical protein